MSPLASTSQGRIAVTVSVALHGVVVAFLSLEGWPEPAGNTPLTATVIYIAPPGEPTETERAVVREALPAPELPPEPPPVTEPPVRTPPAQTPPVVEPEAAARAAESAGDQEAEAEETGTPEAAAPVDFDALGRAAVEAYLDRENGKRTFGPVPGEDLRGSNRSSGSGSAPNVFETHTPRRAGLQPNRSKSALVRRVARICQELTGGVSLFGLMPLCTDNYGRRDLFASIRPDYLDEMPECTEVEIPRLAAADPGADGPGSAVGIPARAAETATDDSADVATAIKCRMVPRDEAYRD